MTKIQIAWVVFGFCAQATFGLRFVIQWFASERQRKSVIPLPFWYLSLFGGLSLLAYAIHKHDPVFIAGQAFGAIVYSRNLYFIYKERRQQQAELDASTEAAQ